MTRPDRPAPEAWGIHPDEQADIARQGYHCEIRRCREPVTVHTTRWFRRGEGYAVSEHFVCSAHGADFSARNHVEIVPAPPILRPEPRLPLAWLQRLDAEAIAAHTAAGWHCDRGPCLEPSAYISSYHYTLSTGRTRISAAFLCDRHAALFAARHGIDLATVRVVAGWLP